MCQRLDVVISGAHVKQTADVGSMPLIVVDLELLFQKSDRACDEILFSRARLPTKKFG